MLTTDPRAHLFEVAFLPFSPPPPHPGAFSGRQVLFFCRSFLGWVGRIRSRKLGTIGRAQRFQKENTQTHTTTITTATKSPLQHGLGLAGLCFSLLSISLFPPLSRRAGLWPLGPRNSAPASPLPWGVTAPPSPPRNRPAGPSSASSSPRTRRPAGKLGEGHRARRKLWDLAGNNSWGRRCGLCAVSLFSGYGSQARAQGEEGERLPGRFLPSPPHSQTQVKSDALGGGCWEPHPGLLFCIRLFHFLPLPAGSPSPLQAVDSAL